MTRDLCSFDLKIFCSVQDMNRGALQSFKLRERWAIS